MKALLKMYHSDPEVQEVFDEMRKETDRGAAVLSHAYMEELLVELLKLTSFKDDPEYFNYLKKWSTFKQKLILCYVTGVMEIDLKQDLEIINDIRNKFAHKREIKEFDEEVIKDKIDELRILKLARDTNAFSYEKPRDNFSAAVALYITYLKDLIKRATKGNQTYPNEE